MTYKAIRKPIVVLTIIMACVLSAVFFIACGNVKVDQPSSEPQQCYVVFFENGGTPVAPQSVKIGDKVACPTAPTREGGYTFAGWYTALDAGKEWKFDSDVTTESNLILFARWTKNGDVPTQYTVTFVTNCDAEVPAQTIPGGGKVTEPSVTKPGYTLLGWYNGAEKWEFATDKIDGSSIILTARWEREGAPSPKCTVSFVTNCNATVNPQTITVGEKIGAPNVTKPGFILDGWYNGDTKWNFATDTVSGSTLTLTAQWRQVCVVSFYPDCATVVPSQTVIVGGKVVEPSVTKPGYTLDGWYNGDTKWSFATDTVSGSVLILRAVWTAGATQTCTVSFEPNCDAVVPAQTVAVGGKVTEPSVTKSGYTLDGWYNGDTKWSFAVNTVSGSTLTLTARWTPVIVGNAVTVTFNVGLDARKAGLSNPKAVRLAQGAKVSEPTVTRSGYTLDGWYKENTSTKWNFTSDTVDRNTTLFAKWTSGGDDDDRIDYTPTMTTARRLYIHYLRTDNDYTDWGIYYWGNDDNDTVNSMTVDASGAVYEIYLDGPVCRGLSSINFIVTQPGWIKDGGDNAVSLSDAYELFGSYHWFINEGDTAHGKRYPSKPGSVGGRTEEKRASRSNVDRTYAKNLPVSDTVSDWDTTGIGYQIFVASFCDSNGDGVGDLNGIKSKLDYLQSLNVDVLWLTPIQSSDSYHGYDCYDYYFIDPKFGTNADYRSLVYEVHRRGMKIIMDLVVNHTSPQNEWFIKSKAGVIETVTYQDGTTAEVNYRDFYRWKNTGGNRYNSAGDGWYYYSSFGSGMPELNYDYQPVRDAMTDVATYWMNYGLDGFRMDAIKHVFMWDESSNATGDVEGGANDKPYNYNLTKNVEFFKEFNYRLKSKYPNCYLLGEQLSGNVDDVSPFYNGMDSLFDFNTYYNLPGRLNGGASAQANEFNRNAEKYRNQRGDRPINSMISSNHDIPRLNETCPDTAKAKLYMSVILTMPGLSWIYYGDEIGLIGDKNRGDNGVRQSMKWTSSWDGRCTAIPDYNLNGGTRSVEEQESDSGSMLAHVQRIAKFRNDNPVLINGSASCSEQDGMLKIVVTGNGKTLTVYHNFSGSSKSISGNVVFGSNSIPAYGTAIVA